MYGNAFAGCMQHCIGFRRAISGNHVVGRGRTKAVSQFDEQIKQARIDRLDFVCAEITERVVDLLQCAGNVPAAFIINRLEALARTDPVAIVEANDSINPADLSTTARKSGSGWVLNGAKIFVPYAHLADFVIVAARTGSGADDIGLFLVEPDSPGVRIRRLNNLDLSRRVCAVELDAVVVPAQAALSGGVKLYDRLVDIAAVAIAADSLGGTERALEMAVEYSKVREQFGRPIGSYQALQHAAAEIVADMEPARSLLWYAAHALDVLSNDAPRAAAMVKARMCEVYMRSADRAVLMHGGIGFTWDHDMHLWFKRARFNESYFGAPPFHRERVATLSGY